LWNEAQTAVLIADPTDNAVNVFETAQRTHDDVRTSIAQASSSRPPLALAAELELAAAVTAIPVAQMHVRLTLSRWGLDQLRASADQIVTELVAEAVMPTRASYPQDRRSPPNDLKLLTVRVSRAAHSVLIEVWDSRPANPQPPFGQSFSQRVTGLSHRYGRLRPDEGGATTWCELALPARAVSDSWRLG
jgi:hypothetical protein